MKRFLAIFLLSVASITSSAHCCYRGGYHHYYSGSGWVAPAIIGGAIGYGLARPYYDPVYVTPPPVVVEQPQVVIQQPPLGYHWQEMIDPQTNQKKLVLVPN